MAKTFDTIISEMTAYVRGTLGQQDTRVGTVLREGFLAPVATQLEGAYSRTDEVELNQSISAAESISEDAMNRLAANFGLARFPGSAASGSVRFSRLQAPPSTIPIPSGTVVSTSDAGDFLNFRTLNLATLSALSSRDPVSGAYYVDVPIMCNSTGTNGNVGIDTIRFHSIPGIDDVTNPNALSGGKDQQTNTELAELMIARAQGNLGTRSGYESLIRSNFSIDDMEIIAPSDPEASRAQFGGEIDITILSGNVVGSQETAASTTTTFYPTFLPVVSVSEITGVENITDTVKVLVPSTDYDVILDTYSPLSRSYQEKSRINLHVTSFVVKPASVFTIRYYNSELVRVIQSFLNDPQNEVLGTDLLVKLAIVIPVNITADIRIIPGYDPTVVQAAASDAVITLFNAKLLGDDVQVSDIVTAMGNVAGVDSVDFTTFKMAKASEPTNYVQEIQANKQEYLRSGTITVTVVG
jgi:uncharacterized phage protein gp47/JayE